MLCIYACNVSAHNLLSHTLLMCHMCCRIDHPWSNNITFSLFWSPFFYFLVHGKESIRFGSNLQNGNFLELYMFWGPLNPEIIFLAVGLCVCLSVCYQHNSKTNYSRIIKLGFLYSYHIQMLLETFHKDRAKTQCTVAHKRILIHYGLWTKFRVSEFSYI